MPKGKQTAIRENWEKARLFAMAFSIVLLFASCGKDSLPVTYLDLSTGSLSTYDAISFISPDTGFIVGGRTWYAGEILTTTDGGQSWTAAPLGDKELFGIACLPGKRGVAAGTDGYIYYHLPPQPGWTFTRQGNWEVYRGVAINSRGTAFLAGGQGYNDGVLGRFDPDLWTTHLTRFDFELEAVSLLSDSVAVACGFGIVARTEDEGRSWQRTDLVGDFWTDIQFLPGSQTGYMCGFSGAVYKSVDGGRTWSKVRRGNALDGEVLDGICFRNEQEGYVCGDRGLLLRTRDGGESWTYLEGLPAKDLKDLWIAGDRVFVVGESGALFVLEDP